MEHLGHYLRSRPGIRMLGLVTSPFHARRAYPRARVHCPASVMLGVIPGARTWEDRAPWIVAFELFKMVRDAVGLSRSPGLSRHPDGATHWTSAGCVGLLGGRGHKRDGYTVGGGASRGDRDGRGWNMAQIRLGRFYHRACVWVFGVLFGQTFPNESAYSGLSCRACARTARKAISYQSHLE
jgi:hypothetical protein